MEQHQIIGIFEAAAIFPYSLRESGKGGEILDSTDPHKISKAAHVRGGKSERKGHFNP